MIHIDPLGWTILAVLVVIFGTPNVIFALRARANADRQPSNMVVAFRFATIMMVLFMPLNFLALSVPPMMGQPWLGFVQFSYLGTCYFAFWLIWKHTKDWRMKFMLLVLSIFLPDFFWIMNVASLLPEKGGSSFLPRSVAGVQLLYFVGGYFVFKHYFPKIRPQPSTTLPKRSNIVGPEDRSQTFVDLS